VPWLYLLLSGVFEVGFTTCMQFDGPVALLLFAAFATLSFYTLTLAMRTLPLGTCYAVFTAIGAVGTAIVGIVFFAEPATPARLALLALIVLVVVALKFVSAPLRSTAQPGRTNA
jgi:quaternary ammonium compound-resistance protein SugE